jgi:hypothetical protein
MNPSGVTIPTSYLAGAHRAAASPHVAAVTQSAAAAAIVARGRKEWEREMRVGVSEPGGGATSRVSDQRAFEAALRSRVGPVTRDDAEHRRRGALAYRVQSRR